MQKKDEINSEIKKKQQSMPVKPRNIVKVYNWNVKKRDFAIWNAMQGIPPGHNAAEFIFPISDENTALIKKYVKNQSYKIPLKVDKKRGEYRLYFSWWPKINISKSGKRSFDDNEISLVNYKDDCIEARKASSVEASLFAKKFFTEEQKTFFDKIINNLERRVRKLFGFIPLPKKKLDIKVSVHIPPEKNPTANKQSLSPTPDNREELRRMLMRISKSYAMVNKKVKEKIKTISSYNKEKSKFLFKSKKKMQKLTKDIENISRETKHHKMLIDLAKTKIKKLGFDPDDFIVYGSAPDVVVDFPLKSTDTKLKNKSVDTKPKNELNLEAMLSSMQLMLTTTISKKNKKKYGTFTRNCSSVLIKIIQDGINKKEKKSLNPFLISFNSKCQNRKSIFKLITPQKAAATFKKIRKKFQDEKKKFKA